MTHVTSITVPCLLLYVLSYTSAEGPYQPTWDSLDSRPLPSWYDEAKVGIFVHWGVFSVPALRGKSSAESFWKDWDNSKPGEFIYEFMKRNYPSNWGYGDFASQFTAELFEADKWVQLFQDAGAKYMVFVTKHREGFANWNTNYSFNWNSMQVGPKRDLVGEITAAVRKTDMRLGLYHNLIDWHNPLFLIDQSNNFSTRLYAEGKLVPELKELINTYQPDLLWPDDSASASVEYFGSREFLAWLYNDSPVKEKIIVNDRWGYGCSCKHGGYWTCSDRYNPKKLQKKKFEDCDIVQKDTWGYGRNKDLSDYYTIDEIVTRLVETISCGGNYLLNVGPTHDGLILPIFEERLRQMGAWLKVNGDAVYDSSPWRYQQDATSRDVWYTQKKSNSSSSGYSVYAFVLEWPENNKLTLGAPIATPTTTINMLGYSDVNQYFEYSRRRDGAGLVVKFPYIPPNKLPSFYAWVLKLDNLGN